MKKVGILFTTLGALLLFAAMFSFGWSIYHAVNANENYEVSIPPGETFITPFITVDTSEHVQVALVFDVLSKSVQENYGDDDNKWQARYNFPVTYRVLDDKGQEIFNQSCDAAWDGCGIRNKKDEQVDSRGGTVTVEHGFEKFTVAPPGRIQLEIKVGEDSSYASVARNVELIIYDKVVTHTTAIASGVAMIILAPFILVVGVLLLVIPSSTKTTLPATDIAPEVRTWAMFAHLAALLAYVGIPFGHIFGPLVIWLAKKDDDAFISTHARESLNFQISMTIYFIISFVLMFVVIGFVLIFILFALHIALTVLAALRANDGQFYKYPFTIRFI